MTMKIKSVTDMIALLCKAPRTVQELEGLTDMHRSGIHLWLSHLHAEGLIYIKQYHRVASGPPPAVYAWQPASAPLVCQQPDAVKGGGA